MSMTKRLLEVREVLIREVAVAEQRLHAADAEMTRASAERAEAAETLRMLHLSLNALESVPGTATSDRPRFDVNDLPTFEVNPSALRPDGSTARVVNLLNELYPRALTAAQMTEEFEHRGWIESKWSDPVATIAQAARRAEDLTLVVRGRDGRSWIASTRPARQVPPPENGNDDADE